jgi:formate hydrogenlyase transcriptional activator
VLQEQEFERLGGTKTIKVDVRLVAATHRDLARMVADGRFREDLYYRLNVFPLVLPPLRERREDIPRLVRHFTQRFARRMGRQIEAIPSAVMEALVRYPWPGNIRELQNVIERALIPPRPDASGPPATCSPRAGQAPGHPPGRWPTPAGAHPRRPPRTGWVLGGPKGRGPPGDAAPLSEDEEARHRVRAGDAPAAGAAVPALYGTPSPLTPSSRQSTSLLGIAYGRSGNFASPVRPLL